MNELELLIDLHRPAERQGPGGDTETKRAIDLARLDPSGAWKIADLGCGTGASTMVLASELGAEVTAVDFLPEFLDELDQRATRRGLAERITTRQASIDELSFAEGEFDVIWSEGAIYNLGFEAGVSAWRPFLKPGGKLVVSEITWFRPSRPAELEAHWRAQYSEIDVASAKIGILEQHGYRLDGFFVLPEECWLDNYYRPMERRFDSFLARHGESETARALVDAERREIALYEQHRAEFGYAMYVATRV